VLTAETAKTAVDIQELLFRNNICRDVQIIFPIPTKALRVLFETGKRKKNNKKSTSCECIMFLLRISGKNRNSTIVGTENTDLNPTLRI